jgi:hypothetical protein
MEKVKIDPATTGDPTVLGKDVNYNLLTQPNLAI